MANSERPPRKLLNSDQLARELGISRSTVKALSETKRIPYISISTRTRRYDLAEVLAALKREKAEEAPAT
jgi:predicted DNA-binding transcriptional regulator AlpA